MVSLKFGRLKILSVTIFLRSGLERKCYYYHYYYYDDLSFLYVIIYLRFLKSIPQPFS